MGTRCASSLCSICGNKAVIEDEFCEHVLNYKGSTYNGLPVWEINLGLDFFEDSQVVQGADPFAKILEKVASKNNRSSSNIIIPKSKVKNQLIEKIYNETNQRSYDGRVQKLSKTLQDLDWS